MKRFLSLFLCLAILLSFPLETIAVYAAGTPTITCEDITCQPGDQITVAVTVANNPGFAYLELTPTYSSELTLVKATNGDLASDFTKGKQYVWIADEDVTDDGLLMTFTFDVAETVSAGEYCVGFVMRMCANYDEEPVTFAVESGTVTVRDNTATTEPTEATTEPSNPWAQYLTWEVVDGEVTITDCDESISGDIVLPATLDGYPVTSIGDEAFEFCTHLESIVIPDSVTSIGDFAFSYCSSLASVEIPNSVTAIGNYAFENCSSLTSIEIPDSVTYIYYGAFSDCSSLTGIWVNADNTNYSSDDYGVLFDKDKSTLIQAPGAISGNYIIPSGVTSIRESAFTDCRRLVGIWADADNSNYSSDSYGVLLNKDKTTIITVPRGITGYYAIPDSVTSIGDGAFRDCHNLTSVEIPNSVTSIGDSAFYNCYRLTSVVIPDSVTVISEFTFSFCYSLKSADISDNVTSIGRYAFQDCGILASIDIPDGVTNIGEGAFNCCSSLERIKLPNSITVISNSAFAYCHNLMDVYYSGTEEQWNAITIGSGNEDLTSATIHYEDTSWIKVEHWYISGGEEKTAYYAALEDALAAATSGTIKLLANAAVDTVVLKPGVTLDLNGFTLTADVLIALNGAMVTDGGEKCIGGGLLKVAKNNLMMGAENSYGVIPVWNGVDGYVFTKVTFQQMARTAGTGAAQYIFLPRFSNAEAAAFLADGGADNGLKLKVGLTWNGGQCQQFYTYDDGFVAQVFASNGGLAFSLTVTGISGITDMVASAMIVTDSYAQAAATGTALTAG